MREGEKGKRRAGSAVVAVVCGVAGAMVVMGGQQQQQRLALLQASLAAPALRAVPKTKQQRLYAVALSTQQPQQKQKKQHMLAALRVDMQLAATGTAVLSKLIRTHTSSGQRVKQQGKLGDNLMKNIVAPRVQSLNVHNAKPMVFPGTAASYGADGGGSGWKKTPVSQMTPEEAWQGQWVYPGFTCYDPLGCELPENPDETRAEAIAEDYADDPSYYGDGGMDDQEKGAPWHAPTPYRGTYMHATFPYENEPTGFFAGFHTVENTGLNVGMGKHREVNSYYYPDSVRVT